MIPLIKYVYATTVFLRCFTPNTVAMCGEILTYSTNCSIFTKNLLTNL